MHFVSMRFVGFFLIVFSIYWMLADHRKRMSWLLLASCVFYMSWNPYLILLILFSASIDYAASLAMPQASPRGRKWLLVGSIAINLSLLGFFKYTHFFLDNWGQVCNWLGIDWNRPVWKIVLPLGISFYTFETISYIVDVYKGRTEPIRNPLDYALFILFFPHLVAGPIVRPRDFLPQLKQPKRFSWNRMHLGVRLFLLGLCKKAVLADHLAGVVDPVFQNPGQYNSLSLWLAAIAYTIQIYGDFSGYSDMAIGIAHTFGFKLPANFHMPYLAGNITEFWRRWHISLSSWLRDYLYIPLGGNRYGTLATYRNLLLTMFLGGLWHGASWTFVMWGLLHGVLLAGHRAVQGLWWMRFKFWTYVGPVVTLLLVMVGWVFFRAQTFTDAAAVLTGMITPTAGMSLSDPQKWLVLMAIAAMIIGHAAGARRWVPRLEQRLPEPAWALGLTAFWLLCLLLLPESGQTFIYFQF